MKLAQWSRILKETVKAWSDDFAPSMGAAISYYTMFSLAPLLVLVIAIAGMAFGAEAVRGQISSQLSGLMGADTAQAIEGMIESASLSDNGWWAGALSVVILIVGATSVFAELQSALDRIWHVPESQKPSGLWGILRARLFSMGLILGLAFLLMVSLAVSAGLAAFGGYLGGLLPGQEALLQVLNIAVSIAVMTALFAMIFKLMPTAKVAWRDVWVGALVTACLFEIGKFGIGLYLGKSGMSDSFAGAGALVILLAWVYYAAQIFLLGAEFTKVYAGRHTMGSTSPVTAPHEPADAPVPTKSGMDAAHAPVKVPAGPPLPDPANADAVRQQLVRMSNALLPQIMVLAAMALLRVMVETRVKSEKQRVRIARKRRT